MSFEADYNDTVLEHFKNPRNCDRIENADAYARVINPACGDEAELFLEIEKGIITRACFLAQGCVATIAMCSLLTEELQGLALQDALGLTRKILLERIGGLPMAKRHAATLGADLVREALKRRS